MKQSEREARQRKAQADARPARGVMCLLALVGLPILTHWFAMLTGWWPVYFLTFLSIPVGVWLFSRWTRRPLLKGK